MEMAKASVLEYQNIGFGRVNVSWTYPWNIRSYVIGEDFLPLNKFLKVVF